MPIPGSIINDPLGMLSIGTAASLVFPSLATLRPLTRTVDTTGQDVKTFADSTNSSYQNIPCRIVPLILVRPQTQEKGRPEIQEYDAKFQVALNAYLAILPEVFSQWQVKVDGVIYQIKSVEHDGNKRFMRLLVTDAVPYGE